MAVQQHEESSRGNIKQRRNGPLRLLTQKAELLYHLAKVGAGAITTGQAFTGPLYVQIGISNRCNYRCVMCWDHPLSVPKEAPYPDAVASKYYAINPDVDRNRALMSWDMFTCLVDDLARLGTKKIKLVGRGESFLHPDVLRMIEYVRRKDILTSVVSNGSLITEEMVEGLVRSDLNELQVSVNAGTPDTYAKVHTTEEPEQFDRITRMLRSVSDTKKRLNRDKPWLHLSFVISSLNCHELTEMARVGASVGAQSLAFNRVSVYEGSRYLSLSKEQDQEASRQAKEVMSITQQHGILTNIDNIFLHGAHEFVSRTNRSAHIHSRIPCYVGWFFTIILADGTVNPCCECLKKVGTLKEHSFSEIWFSEDYRRFRQESKALPKRQSPMDGCRCFNCSFSEHNLSVYNALHFFNPYRVYDKEAYSLGDVGRSFSKTRRPPSK